MFRGTILMESREERRGILASVPPCLAFLLAPDSCLPSSDSELLASNFCLLARHSSLVTRHCFFDTIKPDRRAA